MQCKTGIRSQLQIRTSCQSKIVTNKQPAIHVLRRVSSDKRTPLRCQWFSRRDTTSHPQPQPLSLHETERVLKRIDWLFWCSN